LISMPPREQATSFSTRGAGDAAIAGLLYGVLVGLSPEEALVLSMETAAVCVAGLPISTALASVALVSA